MEREDDSEAQVDGDESYNQDDEDVLALTPTLNRGQVFLLRKYLDLKIEVIKSITSNDVISELSKIRSVENFPYKNEYVSWFVKFVLIS